MKLLKSFLLAGVIFWIYPVLAQSELQFLLIVPAYGKWLYLTNLTAQFAKDGSVTANFNIARGTNFVPYDILMTTNLLTPGTSWNWLGIGYASNNYTFYEQPTDTAFYILAKPSRTMTVGIGDDTVGQCDVPYGLTNVIQIAAGRGQSLALETGGTVVAWGANFYGQGVVPSNLSGVAMISAGYYDDYALLTNGTVTAWGLEAPALGYDLTNVPADLSGVTSIAAGALHSLALCSNGTVVAWGYDDGSGEAMVPAGLSNVTAIAAGGEHSLAVSNGYVVAWGDDTYGQCDAPVGLGNVVDVAAGPFHSVALLQNGTVAAWGDDEYGETDVPSGLSNVVAIAAGGDLVEPVAYSMALKNDGTLAIWGNDDPNTIFGGLNNVIGIAAGSFHALALRTGPPTPVITQGPIDQFQLTNGAATFTSRGSGLYGVAYQWQYNGMNMSGETNASLTLNDVGPALLGAYDVVITDNAGMGSIASSNANLHLVTTPVILSQSPPTTNEMVLVSSAVALDVSASAPGQTNGFPISYQWQFDGTNISGATSSKYTFNATNSGTYTLIISNAAGSVTVAWQITLRYPGGVIGWGASSNGQLNASSALTDVISLAAGEAHSVVALDNGSVSNWGSYWTGSNFVPIAPPPVITNAIAVAAGSRHDLALLQNGTVVAWGLNDFGQTNVPANATNVIAIAAGGQQSLALLKNGTVVQWGQTNAPIPAGLTNVIAIAAGTNFCLALLSDATVVAWGANNFGQASVPSGLSNAVAIAAGGAHALALEQNGTVVAWGDNAHGETNVPAGLSNVMNIAAGDNHSIAVENNGTVVAWGDDTFGETNTVIGLNDAKLIAGGGNFTLAVKFSPTVMYPVNVSQDLLLVYNSNSSDSSNLCAYYLAHRPMAANANVLGIASQTGEFFYATTTNEVWDPEVVTPVLNWLTNNPTKHPTYIILFYDIPTREWLPNEYGCGEGLGYYMGSISYQIYSFYPGWKPFVNHINAGSLADCEAYVDKIANMAANSPGKLVISASAGGYGNTNYYFDDTENLVPGDQWGLTGALAVLADGVSSNSLVYTNVNPDCESLACHITTAMNLAGYFSWGSHSGGLGDDYATNSSKLSWTGHSGWWIIQTIESFNGMRGGCGQGDFVQWFSSNAFGGTNYSNTPVGAVSNVEEPGLVGNETSSIYFGLWAAEKNFAICAWNGRQTPFFQAIGDPFVIR